MRQNITKINKKSVYLRKNTHANGQKEASSWDNLEAREERSFVHVTDSECTGRTPMDNGHIEHRHPSSHMISWTSQFVNYLDTPYPMC